MVDGKSQGEPAVTRATIDGLTEHLARQDRVILELLTTLDTLAKGLPAFGEVATAKAKIKKMLADFRAAVAAGK